MAIQRSLENLTRVVARVTYKDWKITVRTDEESNRAYVQVTFNGPNIENGIEKGPAVEQRCRKWMLSYYMTDTEIVKTVYKAIEAAVLHEMQEQFLYRSSPIYNPHIDVEELRKTCHVTEHRT